MGFKNNQKHPPVSSTALSAVSNIQDRNDSIQKMDCNCITLISKYKMLVSTVRP